MLRTALLASAVISLLAGEAAWEISVPGALPGGKALVLNLAVADGKVIAADAEAPTFNRMVHQVDAGRLVVADGLSGEAVITIPSDGYVPAKGTSLSARLGFDLKPDGETLVGRAVGTVGDQRVELKATAVRLPARSGELDLVLHGEEALHLPGSKAGGQRRTTVCLSFAAEGSVRACRVIPPGSPTDTAYGARATAVEMRLADQRLRGHVDIAIHHQDGSASAVRLGLDGRVYGDRVLGVTTCTLAGTPAGSGCFRGTLADGRPVGRDDAHGELVLHDAIGMGKYVRVFLARRAGSWSAAFATTPNYNNATHDVVLKELVLAGDRLRGGFDLTINLDPWIPKDRTVRTVPVTVDARLVGNEITGTATATWDGTPASVPLDGFLAAPRRVPAGFKTTVKLEEAVGGANAWVGRIFISGAVADGAWTEGRLWNNHNKALKGSVAAGGTLRIADDRIQGAWTMTVEASAGVEAGTYQVEIDGPAVGGLAAGIFTIRPAAGGTARQGRFWASAEAK